MASSNQTPTNSETAQPEGELLPPIPPVVGPPANPGQPLNAPILNDPQTHVNNAPQIDDQYGIYGKILVNNISFQLPIHDQTTVTAYFGKRDMKLEPDGTVLNAISFKTFTPANPNVGGTIWFSFIHRSNLKLKLILVARNEFGSSSKEVNYYHNRDCIGVPQIPASIGDCDKHCIVAEYVAGQLEFKAKFKHGGNLTYLYFDIFGYSPPSFINYALFPKYFEYPNGNPQGPPLLEGISSLSTNLTSEGLDYMCVDVKSFVFYETDTGNYSDQFLSGKIRLE
nr:hypothetical protein [Leptospira biflexa]